jgi:polyphosphate kinase 2 (PPK2 family)
MSAYDDALQRLQVELVSSQIRTLESGGKLLILFEGRDAAGKDGVIRRITEHLSIRATRVVALPKPSDRERGQWFFQRYVEHLPTAGEWVILNRSWYNRAGVERVMGFSTAEEQELFLRDAPVFERMLVDAGVTLVKYWLDISKEKWEAYSAARDEMLKRTHTSTAPWHCVRADDKRAARLGVIRHLLGTIGVDAGPDDADADKVVFPFEMEALTDGRLAA